MQYAVRVYSRSEHKGRVHTTRSTVRADSYKQAKAIAQSLNESKGGDVDAVACVQLMIDRGTVLVPVDQLASLFQDLDEAIVEVNKEKSPTWIKQA